MYYNKYLILKKIGGAKPFVNSLIGNAIIKVKNNGLELQNVSPKLKNNIDVVIVVVTQNGKALEYASPEMKKSELISSIIHKK